MDDNFKKFVERSIKIDQLTNVEIIQIYLEHLPSISKNGKLPFIIQGNLQWDSKNENGIYGDGVWLKSNLYSPVGKNLFDNPVRYYLQRNLNIYEIVGTIDMAVPEDDIENAKVLISNALDKITTLKNGISLLSETSLDWCPAIYSEVEVINIQSLPTENRTKEIVFRPIQISQGERTSFTINDDHIKEVLNFTKLIDSIAEPIKKALETAMDLHASGNRYQSGLSRFINYWASIEFMGSYFYKKLSGIHHDDRGEKKDKVLNILLGDQKEDKILLSDLSENILEKINKCNDIVNPPIKKRLCSVLNILSNSEDWEETLFSPDADLKKSLYQIRNDIAHGSISGHDFEKVASLAKRLVDMENLSRKIVMLTINNSNKLILKE